MKICWEKNSSHFWCIAQWCTMVLDRHGTMCGHFIHVRCLYLHRKHCHPTVCGTVTFLFSKYIHPPFPYIVHILLPVHAFNISSVSPILSPLRRRLLLLLLLLFKPFCHKSTSRPVHPYSHHFSHHILSLSFFFVNQQPNEWMVVKKKRHYKRQTTQHTQFEKFVHWWWL